MQDEFRLICHRIGNLFIEFLVNVSADQHPYQRILLKLQYGEELESYKVKLENFYSDTDVKEQTLQDFQSYFRNYCEQHFLDEFYPMKKSLKCKNILYAY